MIAGIIGVEGDYLVQPEPWATDEERVAAPRWTAQAIEAGAVALPGAQVRVRAGGLKELYYEGPPRLAGPWPFAIPVPEWLVASGG